MSPKKNGKPKETSGETSGGLIVQPHGGALLPGGVVGHVGAGGRPPKELREDFRDIAERGLDVLEGYVQGKVSVKMVGACEKCGHEHEDYELLPTDLLLLSSPKDADRLKALDIAAKYGGVDKLALTPEEQPDRTLTPEKLQDYLERLERAKDIKALEKMLTEPKQIGSGE